MNMNYTLLLEHTRAINLIKYDNGTLTVSFQSVSYTYADVSENAAMAFFYADSKTHFFLTSIRGWFECHKITSLRKAEQVNKGEFKTKFRSRVVYFDANGPSRNWIDKSLKSEEYYFHGNRQRLDGPAVIHGDNIQISVPKRPTRFERISAYMKCEDQYYYEWWLAGKRYDFAGWVKATNLRNNEKAWLLLKFN